MNKEKNYFRPERKIERKKETNFRPKRVKVIFSKPGLTGTEI
jgi:hypothetical protein